MNCTAVLMVRAYVVTVSASTEPTCDGRLRPRRARTVPEALGAAGAPHGAGGEGWGAGRSGGMESCPADGEERGGAGGQFAEQIFVGDEIGRGARRGEAGPIVPAPKPRRGPRVARPRRKKGLSQQALADRI